MAITNREIAETLNKTADLLEIKGENPFRVRAYRNAARTVQSLSKTVVELVSDQVDLSQYPDIGKDLSSQITDFVKTGRFKTLEKVKKDIPEELGDLMDISGLGAKRIAELYKKLEITSIDKLKKALDEGKIREMEGFGKKSEENIKDALLRMQQYKTKRSKINEVEEIARPFLKYLKTSKDIKNIDIAGSYRRRKETVKDLDILVTCKQGSDIMEKFINYDDVTEVVSHGKTRSTVILRKNFHVDLRVVPQVSYGAAMVYFTGSKEHNVAIRKIANRENYKLNEYGVFKGDERKAGKTESEVYKKLGLKFIPPELRENRGEIEAVQKGKLPELVDIDDIKGDLHVHSKYTDGKNTIEEMAKGAKRRGYDYIAMTDHSQHVSVAGGLKPEDLEKQIKEIDRINNKLKNFTVLKGCEVDILDDGKLDLPDDILRQLDLRVCSIHYKFNLTKKQQTDRVIKAMKNKYFNILAHPTGRLINERGGYDIDMDEIIKAAQANNIIIELNSHPDRLDLDDINCKIAKDKGVKVVISTDAHQVPHLDYISYGIGQARRGWLEAGDVLNTKSLSQLKKILNK